MDVSIELSLNLHDIFATATFVTISNICLFGFQVWDMSRGLYIVTIRGQSVVVSVEKEDPRGDSKTRTVAQDLFG